MNRQHYRLFFYEFNWTVFVNHKCYYCYYGKRVVFVVKLMRSELMYFGRYLIEDGLGSR